ncbi:EAL domain-containing protein [Actimicrobium sp. CCI2.3]|uniref:EAL domain-containing protein n=1 Tax=Actimicrobium sp. CCI2.3 TaxID=3048616 RepID=UPI002AB3867B|nr:EAL domain-containing protein [Actimicrobium sp. CCI2.3]MDY7573916.1 EAL domain-containing protein [Actimicrobium sp. CCI2.3]MEB0023048.1 EAL domain-containing protein [Actimicrobium sp. CCI2.3]
MRPFQTYCNFLRYTTWRPCRTQVISGLLLLFLVLFGAAANAAGSLSRNALIVDSEQDYLPFSTGMTDDTAGGFTVDLWKAVAEEAGLPYILHVRPFHEVLSDFRKGKADVLINLAISDQRRRFADFTVPHVIVNGAVFVRKRTTGIGSEDDLAGKSLIVVNGDLAHDYAVSRGWEKKLVLVDTAAGLQLLASGQHDAMLLSKLTGMQTLRARRLTNIEALPFPAGFSQRFAFAVQKGEAELLGRLNEALAITKANGTYDALYLKWFGIYEIREPHLRDYIITLLPVLAVLLLAGSFLFHRRQVERARAKNKYRDLYDQSPDMFVTADAITGNIIDCNQRLLDVTGHARQDVIGKIVLMLCDPASTNLARRTFTRFLAGDDLPYVELQLRCHDGHVIDVVVSASRVFDDSVVAVPQHRLLHLVLHDITDRKLADEARRIAATAFESHEAMMITDAHRVILRINSAFTETTGYCPDDVLGKTMSLLESGRHEPAFFAAMQDSILQDGAWRGELWNRRKNGELYPAWMSITGVRDSHGNITHYVSSHSDITLRKAAEEEISHLAFFDPLTGLPNRRLLMDRLQRALATSLRSTCEGALMFIDLDNFKLLNDTQGHDKGDLLLQQVALRLSACVRDSDTVARIGGDEFIVLLEQLSEQSTTAALQTEAIGENILAALNVPFDLAGQLHHSTPSIGMILFGEHKDDAAELLKRADLAMYQAKAAGRNTLRFFDPEIQELVTAHSRLESELRQGLLHGEFVLYYQAQVDRARSLIGAEVLVRWQHPQRGIVPPVEFIPLAEETGLILPLGQWVLEAACKQLAAWSSEPALASLTIAVNVSACQFQRPDFVPQVLVIIALTGANPRLLKFEITESLLLTDAEDIILKMTALQAHGISFSLDDFGTGYSSLSYLKRLPLDQLKIDRSFVHDVLTDPNDAAIVRTILALGHSLGLSVIAEGVETEAQCDFLAELNCHAYQGFLFSKPVPVAQFEALVAQEHEGLRIAC